MSVQVTLRCKEPRCIPHRNNFIRATSSKQGHGWSRGPPLLKRRVRTCRVTVNGPSASEARLLVRLFVPCGVMEPTAQQDGRNEAIFGAGEWHPSDTEQGEDAAGDEAPCPMGSADSSAGSSSPRCLSSFRTCLGRVPGMLFPGAPFPWYHVLRTTEVPSWMSR